MNFVVIYSARVEKCPKNSKFLVQTYIKVLQFLKILKNFLNKSTKHKRNYMRKV